MRRDYIGRSSTEAHLDDAELIDNIIYKLKINKPLCLDTLTSEHLQYSHPALASIFAQLFNVTLGIRLYTIRLRVDIVPPLKGSRDNFKSSTVEDFRGISISPVLSTILEHCILDL